MLNNPLIQLNNQRRDVLAELRQEIALWLSKPNRTQKILASRCGISQTMLCDILASKRGCSPDTYENIIKALRSSGTKIVGEQRFGKRVGGETELTPEALEMFENKQTENHSKLIRLSGTNRNAGSTFSGRNDNQIEFSK
jgi:hypothetical protein